MRSAIRITGGILLSLAASLSFAQGAYPNRPIRFIAPFPPGGSTDVLCRLLGLKLAEGLAQPVTVDNRPGAGGNIGHEVAARSAGDGYTLLLSSMIEAGIPGYNAELWWAVMTPKGTPAEIVGRLNGELARIMNLPDVQEKYASLGIVTAHGTPQQVTEAIKNSSQQMAIVLKAAGVEAE